MAATPQAQFEKPELSLIMDELEAGEAAVEEKHGTALRHVPTRVPAAPELAPEQL